MTLAAGNHAITLEITSLQQQSTVIVHVRGPKEVPLKLDLSDLAVPKLDDLQVDGLKPSWFSRIFSR